MGDLFRRETREARPARARHFSKKSTVFQVAAWACAAWCGEKEQGRNQARNFDSTKERPMTIKDLKSDSMVESFGFCTCIGGSNEAGIDI